MDNIREKILRERELQKARLVNFFSQSFDTDIEKADETDLEKAHQVGDIHPNGKWVWTQLPNGKYDWRTINGRIHKQQGAGTNNTNKPASPQKTDKKQPKQESDKYQSFHSTRVAKKALDWLNGEDEGMSFLDAFKNGRDIYNDDDKFKKDVSEKLSKLLWNYVGSQSKQYIEEVMGELDHQFKMGKYATKTKTIDDVTKQYFNSKKKILTEYGLKNFNRVDFPVGTVVSCIKKNSAGAPFAGDIANEYIKMKDDEWCLRKDANKRDYQVWHDKDFVKQLELEYKNYDRFVEIIERGKGRVV